MKKMTTDNKHVFSFYSIPIKFKQELTRKNDRNFIVMNEHGVSMAIHNIPSVYMIPFASLNQYDL